MVVGVLLSCFGFSLTLCFGCRSSALVEIVENLSGLGDCVEVYVRVLFILMLDHRHQIFPIFALEPRQSLLFEFWPLVSLPKGS
ncbi:hypothetical protein CAK78_09785 [Aeromonas sp. A35_P]|nr:hypothetical protein CAK78_09785 [Aeromonas sp. A35_P]